MTPEDLIHLQITLEYRLNSDGLLEPFPGSSEQARYIVYEHGGGYSSYFRCDLPVFLREKLQAAGPAAAFRSPELVMGILAEQMPCPSQGVFLSYAFARRPAPDEYPAAVWESDAFVVKIENRPVAWAWSARQNERCAEAAVETLPEFRRKGYARQVTSAWAAQVLDSGRTAFYSHSLTNQPSEALARSLELTPFATCAAYE